MLDYILAFCTLFCIDVIYTHYITSVEQKQALRASFWAMVVFVLASNVIIEYTKNPALIIPAAVGTFCGTFVGVKINK
jgi:uncharacterized protein YebE (UPF0316 family)